MKTKKSKIRKEHRKSIDSYKALLYMLTHPEEVFPEELFVVLNNSYKSLTESVFNELQEFGYTASTEALKNITGSLMLEVMNQINEPDYGADKARQRMSVGFFKGISEIYILLHEAQYKW